METYFKTKGKQFPKFEKKIPQLNTVEKIHQEYSLSTGEKVSSIHPPNLFDCEDKLSKGSHPCAGQSEFAFFFFFS